MRIVLISLVVFLVACGSSSSAALGVTQADIQAAIAPLQTQIQSLQSSNKALTDKLSTLTLIGKVHGVANTSLRLQGEFSAVAPSFGPCTDMGVLIGFTNGTANAPADPLVATYQAFKQCTGYYYEVSASDGSLAPTSRLYFDGPNCTGNMFAWDASGTSFNDQVLSDGVVFASAIDGSKLMVQAGQTPVMTQVQSVYIISNGGCTPDGDLQPMYSVTPNQTSVTGVPGSVGKFQLASP